MQRNVPSQCIKFVCKKDRNQAKKIDNHREEKKKVRSGMSQKAIEE